MAAKCHDGLIGSCDFTDHITAGDFNGKLLQYINLKLSSSYDNLPGAMAAFATANSATNFSAVGTFSA